MYTDKFNRTFCAEHQRDFCHICCCDYRDMNRMAEEEAGLGKKRTAVDEAAIEFAVASRALKGMMRMEPRPSEEVFEQNREYKRRAEEKLQRFAEAGEDVESAVKRACDREADNELDMEAMMQSMARLNPGQRRFELGGPESQKIYDEFVKGPTGKETRVDVHTCSFCGTTSTEVLQTCSRCKKPSYCNVDCMKEAWPAHKKECVRTGKEPKRLRLTWEQVEAYQSTPATGETLEVKAIKDESMMRQVFQCKDRVGVCRRIAAYTDSRQIPGLRVGATVKWKNPRFHYFMDGSSGARIEEDDLKDITVMNL